MTLKVMNFNICCGDDPGGNTVVERAPRVAAIIDRYDPDILGLQEYTPVWAALIQKALGDRYGIANHYRAESSLESTPILWKKERFACVKYGHFWLSNTPEVESKGWDELFDCYRICEYGILREKQSGRSFAHINTHYGFGDAGQVASSKLIYAQSRRISSGPTVITGDFNMSAGMPGYREMTSYFTDVNAATGGNWEPTFHNYGVVDAGVREIFPELDIRGQEVLHIDHCFVSDGIRPVSQRIIRDMPGGGYPSDHYALLSEMEII